MLPGSTRAEGKEPISLCSLLPEFLVGFAAEKLGGSACLAFLLRHQRCCTRKEGAIVEILAGVIGVEEYGDPLLCRCHVYIYL